MAIFYELDCVLAIRDLTSNIPAGTIMIDIIDVKESDLKSTIIGITYVSR